MSEYVKKTSEIWQPINRSSIKVKIEFIQNLFVSEAPIYQKDKIFKTLATGNPGKSCL